MNVTVYSTNMCMACKMTKDLLNREKVNFSEKNVTEKEDYRDEVKQLGFTSAPVTKVEDSKGNIILTITGFDPQALMALRGLSGVIR